MAHPPGHNGVNVSWVTGTQRHQVGVQCPDSLQPQPDVTSRREVQEVRGQIIGSRAAINERCVDLRERRGERKVESETGQTDLQTDSLQVVGSGVIRGFDGDG